MKNMIVQRPISVGLIVGKGRRAKRAAFTLIELLVVIAIIGLLAALIVGGAGIAVTKARRSRVETERNALQLAIDSYKKTKGFYPPDNSNNNTNFNSVQNSLYYELTGATIVGNPGNVIAFQSVSGESLSPATLQTLFNVGGVLNSTYTNSVASGESSTPVNFYKSMRNDQHQIVIVPGVGNFTVLGIRVSGPIQLNSTNTGGFAINPWHYVSSSPTNNPDSYDLWMDVAWGGKTNRVSNWSKDPQVVY